MASHANDEAGFRFEVELNSPQQDNMPTQPTTNDPAQLEELLDPHSTPVAQANPDQRQKYTGRLFALKNNAPRQRATFNPASRSFNYEEIYDEDPYGEEAFPEARVWKVSNDETQLFDQERIEAWRDALDVLLVFIGLFSAIVATFVVQTSQTLQPDYAQLAVIVSLEILRTMSNTTVQTSNFPINITDPRFGLATPSSADVVVNALWFASLAVSLSTALLAVLTKQWLYHYTTSTSGTSQERARIRQFRYAGLERYQVPLIIDLLPILLHIALAFFLAGLAVFLRPLHTAIFSWVVGTACVAYTLYLASIIAPLIDHQCPYKSPLSFYVYRVHRALVSVWTRARSWIESKAKEFRTVLARATVETGSPDAHDGSTVAEPNITTGSLRTLAQAERQAVVCRRNQIDVDGIVWLYHNSTNSTVRTIALEAFGGLQPAQINSSEVCRIVDLDLPLALQSFRDPGLPFIVLRPGTIKQYNRLLRAYCIGDRVNAMMNHFINPEDSTKHEPWWNFALKVFPWFAFDDDEFPPDDIDLITLLTPANSASNPIFPLAVWAATIRLAKRHFPCHPAIASSLISLRILDSDCEPDSSGIPVGAVSILKALSDPLIRSLALDYVGIEDLRKEHPLLPVHTTILSLMPEHQSDEANLRPAYASLFSAVMVATRAAHCSPEVYTVITELLEKFLEPCEVSWEILWNVLYFNYFNESAQSVLTPDLLHRLLTPVCQSHALEGEDIPWANQAISQLSSILYTCVGSGSVSLSEAICTSIYQWDLLPLDIKSKEDTSPICIFWLHTCAIIPYVIEHLHGRSQGLKWYDEWEDYIFKQERLVFLFKMILPTLRFSDGADFYILCRHRPTDPVWSSCFHAMLSLFHDERYLANLIAKPWIGNPRYEIWKELTKIKAILQDNHDLSGPEYDIPEVNDNDDLILTTQDTTDNSPSHTSSSEPRKSVTPPPIESPNPVALSDPVDAESNNLFISPSVFESSASGLVVQDEARHIDVEHTADDRTSGQSRAHTTLDMAELGMDREQE